MGTERVPQVLKRTMPGTGDEVSILGFGCMRFKRNLGATDMEKAERLVAAALAAGVNYFDTAYIYPGNEKATGALLNKTDELGKRRDRVFVATKLPFMMVKTREDMDKYLLASLDRLGMDYIDYYLVHSISDFAAWEKGKRLGLPEFLRGAKAAGKIRHIGFSWHGNLHDFRLVVDDFDWEFCQIQYNYLDENFQAGTEGLEYAAAKGVGLVVMEPLRGGMIVGKMPPAAKRIIEGYRDASGLKRSPAEWGLRWVWNHPEAGCVLSGMNEPAQVEENCRAASDALAGSLAHADLAMIGSVRDVFQGAIKVNCTGCAYCMPCPYGVNIPSCFASYNSHAMFGGMNAKLMYNFSMRGGKGKPQKASACKKCGVCEKKCPQHIPIIKTLEEAAGTLESPFFNIMVKVADRFIG
ncbi:MAG: aldo/keto reductase [Clostridiales Family XIII bacterium]|jgi:predicted aldo/keto reductase-like oxidoreductase|nr:aldo/keto reductase [Clostridiales Family XIII bacterium]